MLIRRADSLLLVVDIQQKLAPAIHRSEQVVANAIRLLEGSRQLDVPAFVSEQYVRGLGPSLPEISTAAVHARFFEKTHFSCAAEPDVLDLLASCGRRQVILCGTEAHVCVLQTALGLREAGYEVFLVADAAGSRTPENHQAALERLRSAEVRVVTTEMVLFEWLHRAGTEEFRALLPLIK